MVFSSPFAGFFRITDGVNTLKAALPFSFFVAWLLAFPMKGFLLPHAEELLLWFLLPHILALLLIGLLVPSDRFQVCSSVGCVITILLTGLFPLFPAASQLLMSAIGLSAAFVTLRAVLTLQQAGNIALASAVGLIGGNLLLLACMRMPIFPWSYLVIGLPLSVCLLVRPAVAPGLPVPLPLPYFMFLFIFSTISGLMYGFLMPRYAVAAFVPGAELGLYLAAVALGLFAAGARRDLLLLGGVVLGMISFSLIQGNSPAFVNGSMFAMQSAAGCVDLFILLLLLDSRTDALRASGYGLAAVCSGIAAGHLFALLLPQATETLVAAGNIILAVAFLTFHFLRSKKPGSVADETYLPERLAVSRVIGALEYDLFTENGPKGCRWKLTSQEKSVLEQVCMGKTYKDAASVLGITESTVKTYMKRIFAKADVSSKEALLGKLMQMREDSQ